MKLNIPFTDLKVTIGTNPETSKSRGFASGKFSKDPRGDVKGYKVDSRSLYTMWRNSGDIYACVREIYQGVASGGNKFYDPNDPKKEREPNKKAVQKVVSVLRYQYGSIRAFKRNSFKPHLIAGNAYLEEVRNPLGDILGYKSLDPRTMAAVSDQLGNVHRYIQTISDSSGYWSSDPVIFKPEEIIHWKHEEDPNNEVFGFSPLEPVVWEARTDLNAMISNNSFFENDATPSTWWVMDDEMSDEDMDKALEYIEKRFKGSKNRGKGGVLRGVKEIKSLRLSHQEMEYLNGRKFTTGKICAAFGVPPSIIGYTEGVNYTNHEGQRKEFHEGTIVDYDEAWTDLINEIIERLGLQDQIAHEVKPPIFDSDEALFNRAAAARRAGLLTINGARRMIGEDPIDPAKHGDSGDMIILGDGASAVRLPDVGLVSTPEDLFADAKTLLYEYGQSPETSR